MVAESAEMFTVRRFFPYFGIVLFEFWVILGAPNFVLHCALGHAFEGVDVISGILESPQFKGREPLAKLTLASELLKENKLSRTDSSYILLDWVDQYLREPADPLERLKRWSDFNGNDKFSVIKVPRDYLNRVLLAEYLAKQANFARAPAHKKLEILRKLRKKNLVEWSVALSYENLIAGSILYGAKISDIDGPMESLTALKKLREENLIGNHYKVMAEGLLAAEALSRDADYEKGSPLERLIKLRELERKGLIGAQTRKELEKLSAWRLVTNDPGFLKLEPSQKKLKLSRLKNDGLITASTTSDLNSIFKVASVSPSQEQKPSPIPPSGLQEKQ